MLGYFDEEGTRNPTLRANKGDRVRIVITNGETMTHDIAMGLLGIKSEIIVEKVLKQVLFLKLKKMILIFAPFPVIEVQQVLLAIP